MRLIVLGSPPIVIEHEKATEIKTRYLNGEKIPDLEKEYGFSVKAKNDFVLIKQE